MGKQEYSTLTSGYEELLPDDCAQFNAIMTRYMNLTPENIAETFDLKILSLSLADRWSEIASTSAKIVVFEKGNNSTIQKTDFKTWCYNKMSRLKSIHEDCRVMWRLGEEKSFFYEKIGSHK